MRALRWAVRRKAHAPKTKAGRRRERRRAEDQSLVQPVRPTVWHGFSYDGREGLHPRYLRRGGGGGCQRRI